MGSDCASNFLTGKVDIFKYFQIRAFFFKRFMNRFEHDLNNH